MSVASYDGPLFSVARLSGGAIAVPYPSEDPS